MNNTFSKIIASRINRFVTEFSDDSKSIFCNEEGELIHSLEFGIYREKIVKELLQFILPQRLSIGSGFIITKKGKISTQCDIIIYDKNNCPIIESDEKQTFFPIECVVAVGEIKSGLKKIDLKNALTKLQKVKKLRDEIDNDTKKIYRRPNNVSMINTKFQPEDSIVSFLICNEITDLNNIENYIKNNVYGKENCYHTRHNLVLSVKDGLLLYKYNDEVYHAPIFDGNQAIDEFIPSREKDNNHILIFLSMLYYSVSINSIFLPDMSEYINDVN